MALSLPLERMQRWMQEVVGHPGTLEEAVATPGAQSEVPRDRIGEVILPSRTLNPTDRVGIYQHMYLLRMEEALATDYPALKHFLGDEGFFDLVRGYVTEHPSRSYTLNRLGDHLPAYVKGADGIKRREFCHDLARLELALSEVFDAAETPCLAEAEIAAVPAEAWEGARLVPVEAFRLLVFRYPVNAYLQSVRDESHDHPGTRIRSTWLVVYRRDYTIRRLDLTRPAHDLLADLVAGRTLGQALATALSGRGRKPSEAELFRWFREWVAGGIFRKVVGLEGFEPSTSRL